MDHSLLYLNETIGHDLQDHPKRMGSGGGFWKKKKKKKLVHQRREWKISSVFLSWEPQEQHEKAKIYDTGRWAHQVNRCPICYWEEQWNGSRKEWRSWAKADMTSSFGCAWWWSKVCCCKEQYCIGIWNVTPMNQGKLEWSNTRCQEWTSVF